MNKNLITLSLLVSLPTFSANIEQSPFVMEHEATAYNASSVFAGLSVCSAIAFSLLMGSGKNRLQNIIKHQKAYNDLRARMQNGEFDNNRHMPWHELNNFSPEFREKLEAEHKARMNQRAYENVRARMQNGEFDHWRGPYGIPFDEIPNATAEQRAKLEEEFNERRNNRRNAENARQNQEGYENFRKRMENGDYDLYGDYNWRLPFDNIPNCTPEQRARLQEDFDARQAKRRAEQEAARERKRHEDEARANQDGYADFERKMENGDFDNNIYGLPFWRIPNCTAEQRAKLQAEFEARRAQRENRRREEEAREDKRRKDNEDFWRNYHENRRREEEERNRHEENERGDSSDADAMADWNLFGLDPRTTTRTVLDKAWRKLRAKEHPDKCGHVSGPTFDQANEKYKNLSSAYDRLCKKL